MIAMTIGLIVMGAAVRTFFSMQTASRSIDQRSGMAVKGRGTMYLIEENIRLMGFNPEGNMNPKQAVVKARPGLLKFNRNKDLEKPSGIKTTSIGLRKSDDPDRNGIPDEGVSRILVNRIPAADHIAAMGFAYAFDDNEDGAIDVSDNGHVRWAYDSDGSGSLDTELDTDHNGEIKKGPGSEMSSKVGFEKIRAVKIWVLVRSEHPVKDYDESKTFNIGGKEYAPGDDDYAHMLFTTTVRCRNMF